MGGYWDLGKGPGSGNQDFWDPELKELHSLYASGVSSFRRETVNPIHNSMV